MKKLTVLLGFLAFLSIQVVFGQTRQITGTVTSAMDGLGIPGASVVVKGTTIGVSTDIDGNYSLNVPEDATVLVFTYVGMKTQEIEIAGQTTINVVLESDTQELEEVMVVAYGTVKKESFTGSAEVVSNEKIEKIQTADVTKALEGTAPGIQATSGGGQPGDGAAIRIRGFGSANSSNAPLYVVDGVPYDGYINAINPDDIESITILKEASASALYGARGANGVIMINTKKGKAGSSKMEFRSRVGIVDRSIPEYERVNEQDYYELMWEGFRNSLVYQSGIDPTVAGEMASAQLVEKLGFYNAYDVADDELIDPVTGKLNPSANLKWDEDWQEELFRIAKRQEYQFSVSGGQEKSDYYASFGYLDEEGLVHHSGYNRISARLNVNQQPREWFKTGLNMSGSVSKQDVFLAEGTYTTNPFYYTRVMGPIYPVYLHHPVTGDFILDANGEKMFDFGDADLYDNDGNLYHSYRRPYAGQSNLVSTLALDERSNRIDNVGARAYAEFQILEGLSFRTNISGDYYGRIGTTYQNRDFGDAANVQGRLTKSASRNLSYTFNQLLTYAKTFGDHNIEALVGHEAYSMDYSFASATRTGFPFGGVVELSAAAVGEGSTSYRYDYAIEGWLSRLSYDFQNKYYFSASYRRDGSSRFHRDFRWGNFWSVGASWRVTQEEFLQGIDAINNLKFKVSYGEQGNDAIGTYYGWQSFYDLGWDNNMYNGAVISTLENKELQWEVSKNFNTGIEFRVFNRLSGEFNFFNRGSSNLLFEKPLPPSTGIDIINVNIGELFNRGFEFQLNAQVVRDAEVKWNVDFNIAHFKNEFTKLPQEGIIVGTKRWEVGRSIYDFWIREDAGIDPETGEVLYWMDELDEETGEKTGNRVTTTNYSLADRYFIGSAIPDFYGGLTNTVSWKGLELSLLMVYSYGGEMFDGNYRSIMHEGDYGQHWHTDILNRWQQPGDDTDIPRIENGNVDFVGTSSRFLYDASYLNIKNIQLSYQFPKSVASQLKIQSLKMFVAADNVKMFTKHAGMDPQQAFTGVTDFGYVPVRTLSVGLNLNF